MDGMQVLMRSKVADPTTATLPRDYSRPAPKGDRTRGDAAPQNKQRSKVKAHVAQPTPIADIKVAVGGELNKRPARAGDIEMGRLEPDASMHSHRSSTDNAPLLHQQVLPYVFWLPSLQKSVGDILVQMRYLC